MANPQIKLKRSSTQNKRPTPANVPLGELALNTYDGYLYASKDVGAGTTVITVNPWRVGTGTDSYDINFTAGNVGINSASPTALLDVNGGAHVSGDISIGSTTNIVKKVTDVNSWVIKDTNFSVSSQQTNPMGLYFKPDGTKMFIIGTQSPRNVDEYALSTAWDITSASHTTAYSVNSQDTLPQGLFFSPNGENMFVAGHSSDSIHHYTLSTGWDLDSTVTHVGSHDVSSQDTIPTGVTFGDSGTKMYVVGRGNDSIYQYNLSSAYTITSGVSLANTLDIGTTSTIITNGFSNPHGISISSDGTKIWIVGNAEDRIDQINLSTAYDLSTASYSNDFTAIGWYNLTPTDIYVNESAEKAFSIDSNGDDVHEIDIATSGLSIEANPTVESANINLNNNVQVKGNTWFDERIIVNGSGSSYFNHNLHVQGSLTLRGIVDISDGSNDRIQFGGSDDAKIYYDGTDNFFDLVFSTADNNGLRILDTSESELLRVTNDGKVGINSESPTAKLDVNGDANISGVITATEFHGDGSNVTGISTLNITDYGVGLGGGGGGGISNVVEDTSPQLGGNLDLNSNDITGTGNLNITGVSTFTGDVSIASTVSIGTTIDIIPYDNLGTLSFEGSAGQLLSITNNLSSGSIFSVNDISGLASIDVDADGTIQLAPNSSTEYVGIGSTVPTAKLDVNGDVNVSGVITATSFSGNGSGLSGIVTNIQAGANITVLESPTGNFIVTSTASGGGGGGTGTATTITLADESSDTTCFPIFATNATGDQEPKTGSNLTFNSSTGALTAGSFVKDGGTSSEFLKADGSVDSSTYLTSYTETQTLDDVLGLGNTSDTGLSVGVVTATSFVKDGGTSSQFLKADGSVDSSTYLTSYTETDPVVGAISGIVKADGGGNISAASAGTDYLAPDGDGSGLSGILTNVGIESGGTSVGTAVTTINFSTNLTATASGGIATITSSGGGVGVSSDGTEITSDTSSLNFVGTGLTITDDGTTTNIHFPITSRTTTEYTATAGQTTFSGLTYTVGLIDVYLNGSKLDSTDFTATNGTSVVLTTGASVDDRVVVVSHDNGHFIPNNAVTKHSTEVTATAGQTSFSGTYTVGFVDVFLNGSKLDSSEFTATNGTSITLTTGATANDIIEIVGFEFTNGSMNIELSNDGSPELGGNLDIKGFNIVDSVGGGSITATVNGVPDVLEIMLFT